MEMKNKLISVLFYSICLALLNMFWLFPALLKIRDLRLGAMSFWLAIMSYSLIGIFIVALGLHYRLKKNEIRWLTFLVPLMYGGFLMAFFFSAFFYSENGRNLTDYHLIITAVKQFIYNFCVGVISLGLIMGGLSYIFGGLTYFLLKTIRKNS